MRKAVIDLGTNTFNLLIADVTDTSITRLYSEKKGVGFGLKGLNNNQLSEDALRRAYDVLKAFKSKCVEFQTEKIIALGTSALRTTDNAQEFIDEIETRLEIQIQIISGEQEAELIYYGVKQSFEINQPTLIMDIGGGSTEFILADASGILKRTSLKIGISRIYQQISTADPIMDDEILQIESWIEKVVGDSLNGYECDTLIGASGSFETLFEMIWKKAYRNQTSCYHFEKSQITSTLNWLIHSTKQQRDEHDFIIPIRKIMGPISSIETLWAIRRLNISDVWLSPFSLKEGALLLY